MALAIKPPQDRKRVKVYELRDNDWYDRGTGFCTGAIVEVSLLGVFRLALASRATTRMRITCPLRRAWRSRSTFLVEP